MKPRIAELEVLWNFAKRLVNESEAEEELCAAILFQAMSDLFMDLDVNVYDCGSVRSTAFTDAVNWFYSTDITWPFSFERICQLFDINPSRFRRMLIDHGCLPRLGGDITNGERRREQQLAC